MTGRPAVPKSVQVEVFFRDRWLCHICRRPVVFAMTFKLLSEVLGLELPHVPIAMYHKNWPRDKAPLLDELARPSITFKRMPSVVFAKRRTSPPPATAATRARET